MKKKLLALYYRPPLLGSSQNAQGQNYILQSAQKFFEIRVLSFKSSKTSDQNENYFDTNNLLILKIFNLLVFGKSPRLTHLWNKEFFNAYKSLLNEFKPDVIYVDHVLMMQYPLKYVSNSKICLYNEESQLYIKKYNLRKNILDLIKNHGLSDFEKKSLLNSEITFMITGEETKYLKNIGFKHIKTMPYAVDDDYFSYGWNSDQKIFSLLFIGDYSHLPNKEAAMLICKKIYPATKNLKIKIILVGRNINKIKKYISNDIDCFENVEDVRPFYRESTLFVAPIFSGAGMRIKILEAAYCGIPILMSPLANLGVNLENSKEAFIKNDINEMIESIKDIYNSDHSNLLKVSNNAYKKVKSHFSLSLMNKLYDEIFSEL